MNPSDKQWKEFNRQLMEHAKKLEWSSYRMTRFDMAEFLRKEKRFGNALETYLEVCYLDLNGLTDNAAQLDAELLREFPAYDKSLAIIAPGVVKRIKTITKRLNINNEKIKTIFHTHNERIRKSLGLPETPDVCWQKLEKEL